MSEIFQITLCDKIQFYSCFLLMNFDSVIVMFYNSLKRSDEYLTHWLTPSFTIHPLCITLVSK